MSVTPHMALPPTTRVFPADVVRRGRFVVAAGLARDSDGRRRLALAILMCDPRRRDDRPRVPALVLNRGRSTPSATEHRARP